MYTQDVAPTMRLSPKQVAVLDALAGGLSQAETGRLLFMATNTVHNHAANIRLALGAVNLAVAVRTAMRLHLIA